MSSLDFDLDSQMSHLESEWRQAYEAGIGARAELQALAATPKPSASAIAFEGPELLGDPTGKSTVQLQPTIPQISRPAPANSLASARRRVEDDEG